MERGEGIWQEAIYRHTRTHLDGTHGRAPPNSLLDVYPAHDLSPSAMSSRATRICLDRRFEREAGPEARNLATMSRLTDGSVTPVDAVSAVSGFYKGLYFHRMGGAKFCGWCPRKRSDGCVIVVAVHSAPPATFGPVLGRRLPLPPHDLSSPPPHSALSNPAKLPQRRSLFFCRESRTVPST